MFDEYVKGLS